MSRGRAPAARAASWFATSSKASVRSACAASSDMRSVALPKIKTSKQTIKDVRAPEEEGLP